MYIICNKNPDCRMHDAIPCYIVQPRLIPAKIVWLSTLPPHRVSSLLLSTLLVMSSSENEMVTAVLLLGKPLCE